jgi:hypothetical protein
MGGTTHLERHCTQALETRTAALVREAPFPSAFSGDGASDDWRLRSLAGGSAISLTGSLSAIYKLGYGNSSRGQHRVCADDAGAGCKYLSDGMGGEDRKSHQMAAASEG